MCHVVYATDTFGCGLWGSMLTLLAHATCDVRFHVVTPNDHWTLPADVNATMHALPETPPARKKTYYSAHPSTNARFFLPSYLDADVETALYLDTDTLIDIDIAEVFAFRHEGVVAAFGGHDPLMIWNNDQPIPGLSNDRRLFGAGVFLADIHRWRARNWTARMLELYTHSEELTSNDDQLIFNVIAAQDDGITNLPDEWDGRCLGCGEEAATPLHGIHHWCCQNKWWHPDGNNHRYALRLLRALPTNDSMCVMPFRAYADASTRTNVELDTELHTVGLMFILVVGFICIVVGITPRESAESFEYTGVETLYGASIIRDAVT